MRSITNSPSVVVYLFSSSTFKDPERASLRDSGHGDSDQADSDQDTNKGSCCDMSAKEALKMKATGIKPPPLEQGESSIAKLDDEEWKVPLEPSALQLNDYHPVSCGERFFFHTLTSVLLSAHTLTHIWTWLLHSPRYFVPGPFSHLKVCALRVFLKASEQVCILYTSSVYQSRQAHYVFISPTTSASPFSPPSLSTHLWNFDNGTRKMT